MHQIYHFCGRGGIRTHGEQEAHIGFQDQRTRPLCDPSLKLIIRFWCYTENMFTGGMYERLSEWMGNVSVLFLGSLVVPFFAGGRF